MVGAYRDRARSVDAGAAYVVFGKTTAFATIGFDDIVAGDSTGAFTGYTLYTNGTATLAVDSDIAQTGVQA